MTKGVTQVLTLMILVEHEQPSDEDLDGFIAEALAEARKARLPGWPISWWAEPSCAAPVANVYHERTKPLHLGKGAVNGI
jgi:hypothetical protein